MKKRRDQMLNGANKRPFLFIHNGGFVQKVEKGEEESKKTERSFVFATAGFLVNHDKCVAYAV